ncbi:unnamed protein product [Linum tenue]|uniref:Uncharacterized protein n=1 Tax=Linum tenue TaxID=586396 RepID=A0AAV0KWQ4_9ROSI|nr:unnamed protein product [Linum tenue]
MSGVTASPQILNAFLPHSTNSLPKPTFKSAAITFTPPQNRHLACSGLAKPSTQLVLTARRGTSLRCRSSTDSADSTSEENESKSVLDAFFLGKALAEVLNERLESAVGEIMSTIGKLQSDQQKHIQGFQEDVVGRAKKAKQEAAQTTSVVEASTDPETDISEVEVVTGA